MLLADPNPKVLGATVAARLPLVSVDGFGRSGDANALEFLYNYVFVAA